MSRRGGAIPGFRAGRASAGLPASGHRLREKAFLRGSLASDPPRAGHDRRAFRLPIAYRTSTRAKEMDDSIRAMFPDDDNDLGPFLGNLPPEILDVVVKNLSWFQRMTFAMVGKACREAVERVPSTRAVLTEEERKQMEIPEWKKTPPHAVAVVERDVEELEWLIQRYDATQRHVDRDWRQDDDWFHQLGWLAAKHGKMECLECLRANNCSCWNYLTCDGAAEGGHLEVLQWARELSLIHISEPTRPY